MAFADQVMPHLTRMLDGRPAEEPLDLEDLSAQIEAEMTIERASSQGGIALIAWLQKRGFELIQRSELDELHRQVKDRDESVEALLIQQRKDEDLILHLNQTAHDWPIAVLMPSVFHVPYWGSGTWITLKRNLDWDAREIRIGSRLEIRVYLRYGQNDLNIITATGRLAEKNLNPAESLTAVGLLERRAGGDDAPNEETWFFERDAIKTGDGSSEIMGGYLLPADSLAYVYEPEPERVGGWTVYHNTGILSFTHDSAVTDLANKVVPG